MLVDHKAEEEFCTFGLADDFVDLCWKVEFVIDCDTQVFCLIGPV